MATPTEEIDMDLVSTIRDLIADDDFGNGANVPLGALALATDTDVNKLNLFELHKKGTIILISLDFPGDDRHGGPTVQHPHCDDIVYHLVALPQ